MPKKKKVDESPVVYVPKTPIEVEESRMSLAAQVESHKRRVESGKAIAVRTPSERRADQLSGTNIVCLADVMAPVMETLKSMQAKSEAHADEIRQRIASLQPDMCLDHPGEEILVNESLTISKSWQNNNFTVVYDGCPACQAEVDAAMDRAKWLDRGIPSKVLHATFDNFEIGDNDAKRRVVKKFRKQVQKGKGFIIAVGLWGTGKTHLAAATVREVGDGIFITMHDLVGELRQTYTENTGQDKMVDKYRKAKVLVLDEVSIDVFDPSTKKGLDIPPILYRVLGYRHDKDLLTVLTSNNTIDECMSILGEKLRDRIRTSFEIANFTWESHRQPEKL